MTVKKSILRRAVAGIGAIAIAIVGLSAMSAPAFAAPSTGNIDAAKKGSIIIHKHVEDAASTPGNPAGAPLKGVTFKVTEVLKGGLAVPLATSEGWTAIKDLTAADVPGDGFTLGTSQSVVTEADGIATAGPLSVGLYLVEETGSGDNLIEQAAAPFLVTIPYPSSDGKWNYDVDVYPKNVLGSLAATKTAGTPDKPADVVVGAIVPFTIAVPVVKRDLDYVSLEIVDALSAGLGFSSWGAVKIGDALLIKDTDYTISSDNKTVTFTAAGIAKLNLALKELAKGESVEVSAVISAKVLSLGKLDNIANVKINGKPAVTPEVTSNWAGIKVTKTDAASGALLANATFELYASNKTTLLATGTTNATGELSFVVWVGNNGDVTEGVWLKETVAPQGYVLPADPWTGEYTLTAGATETASITLAPLGNYKAEGPDLPLTGAQGTLAMSIGGLAIIAVGAALIVMRRRRSSVEA